MFVVVSGRTRFSMLETIRQFAEEQLVNLGEAAAARTAHARHFAGREADVLALWDSPRQREAQWFTAELANLRTAFRWATDQGELDVAATIARPRRLGLWEENYESTAWVEDLIESACAAAHPRLALLYVLASQCYNTGRIDDAVRYSDAGQKVIGNGIELPFGSEGLLGTAYINIGQPERWVEWCLSQVARGRDTHTITRACLVDALAIAGCAQEAMAAADGLVDAAEATGNPFALSNALTSEGLACRDTDPVRALGALRRAHVIAQDTGNSFSESHSANVLSQLETQHGDALAALDYLALSIRNYHDSGNTAMIRSPLALLAALLDRLGRYESAAMIAGFGSSPLSGAAFPETSTAAAHVRAVFGNETYESLARNGEAMTIATIVAYAYEQID